MNAVCMDGGMALSSLALAATAGHTVSQFKRLWFPAGYRYKPGPPKGPTTPRFSFSDATMKKNVMQMERKFKAELAASAVEHQQFDTELMPDAPF